ncbi:hypothetical protein ANCDUO_19374, partial [Ancylostoma duodenale]
QWVNLGGGPYHITDRYPWDREPPSTTCRRAYDYITNDTMRRRFTNGGRPCIGSIPWFFVSEIFYSNARGNANAIATMTNWCANVVVGLTFLPINVRFELYE